MENSVIREPDSHKSLELEELSVKVQEKDESNYHGLKGPEYTVKSFRDKAAVGAGGIEKQHRGMRMRQVRKGFTFWAMRRDDGCTMEEY